MTNQRAEKEKPMATFNVFVKVIDDEPGVVHINVNPESVPLNGIRQDTIVWTIITPLKAKFIDASDIGFITETGQAQFTPTLDSDFQITATIDHDEQDQTIYTYFLTVHLIGHDDLAIRVDPEVDNPPPPPG
jgi:hypothetical protein